MYDRPILTVLPDLGIGPFLWINRSADEKRLGVGPNCCSYDCACDSHPMSEGLLADFSTWIQEFEAAWRPNYEDIDLDWDRFHTRGMELAERLKSEVGAAFRVVYIKPCEDPNYRLENRREILGDGSVVALPPLWEIRNIQPP